MRRRPELFPTRGGAGLGEQHAATLGAGYVEGWAGAKDDLEAVRWFRIAAARLSDPDGWLGLGRMYEQGRGVVSAWLEAAVLVCAWRPTPDGPRRGGAWVRRRDLWASWATGIVDVQSAAVRSLVFALAADQDPGGGTPVAGHPGRGR